ncbi:hypothetical protein Pfo_004379 [Paulownia fortunei]|nr:hypothetical protein Pfo_004379 [Paulownia fortunei]
MGQARYWMWAKRKVDLSPHILAPAAAMSSCGDSWEEQAFEQDASGPLGGCVWPPRSYSCSFCRREFRSAQALGGHMNVHRRDRARLKQSSIPQLEVVPQNHALNPCTSFDDPFSSHISTFLYNNSNPEFSDTGLLVSPSSHVIRVSSPPATKVNSEEKGSSLCFFSPVVQKNHKNSIVSSPPASWSSFVAEKRDGFFNSIKNEEKKSMTVKPDTRAEKEDFVTEDLPMSVNLVVSQKQTNTSSDEEVSGCKRRRVEAKPLSFFPKLSAVDGCLPQSDMFNPRSGAFEELDLELRLGDAPKVK